jgi:T5SS/PEP-CTERM-associated repeat protein
MFRQSDFHVRFLFIALGLLADAQPTKAADIFWRLPAGGTFSSAGSWVGSVVPGANDIARFALTPNTVPLPIPEAYTVSFTAQAATQGLVVEDDFVTFDLNGHVYRTPGGSNRIGTVPGRQARLTIVDGFWDDNLSGDLAIGSNGLGTLVVSTGGSFFGQTIKILNGSLVIQNGGLVSSPNASVGDGGPGAATVTGASSGLSLGQLSVGGVGDGTLSVLAGGRVENDGETSIGNDFFSSSIGTVNVDGASSLWINNGPVRVGAGSGGLVNITGGGLAQLNSIFIGRVDEVSTYEVAVTVQGINSRLACKSMAIGEFGNGVLTIADSGLVQIIEEEVIGGVTGGTLTIGSQGEGEMNISTGGRLEAVETILGGSSASGAGLANVTVSGAGSELINSGDLKLSSISPAFLTITDGATVENDDAFVGFSVGPTDGEAIVDGANSTWVNHGNFVVGNRGLGAVTISNQGRVTSVNGIVGADLGTSDPVFLGRGIGTVTVDGAGSEWANSATLTVGMAGTGTLNILASAVVDTGTGLVGDLEGGVGSVHIDGTGSRWTSTGGISIGFLGEGELTLNNGGAVQAQQVFVESNGTLSGSGPITGNLQNGGTVVPGAVGSIGALQVSGSYTQFTGGFLDVEIGDSSVDLLSVGAATLDGILRLHLLPGTVPAVNVALAATSLSGQFDNAVNGQRLATVDGLGSFIVNYGAGSAFNPNQIVLSNYLIIVTDEIFSNSFE